MSDILKRIEQDAGVDNLVDILSDRLDASDLNSLLMEVLRRRALKRTPAVLLADYLSNRFVQPAGIDPRKLLRFDDIAFSSLPPDFEAVELSPLCPLGTNSVVATVHQNKSVGTVRGIEVVSDPTNVLALECARRRRLALTTTVRLAASHRVVRPQFAPNPNFRLFALCSAGRDTSDMKFRDVELEGHISFHLRALTAFLGNGPILRVAVTVLDERFRNDLEDILNRLRAEHAAVEITFDDNRTTGRGYYKEVCFKIHCRASGDWIELSDGGLVDWGAKLLSNAKERLFISGIGSERACGLKA